MVATASFPEPFADLSNLGGMAQTGETRIQLCGRFVVHLGGRRVEDALPGAKGACCSPTSCSTGSAGSTATSC